MKIPTDKIREVIDTGGKVIREIVEKVNVEDDGTVKVASSSGAAIEAAMKWIKSIVSEPELNAVYEGKVVKVMDFAASKCLRQSRLFEDFIRRVAAL